MKPFNIKILLLIALISHQGFATALTRFGSVARIVAVNLDFPLIKLADTKLSQEQVATYSKQIKEMFSIGSLLNNISFINKIEHINTQVAIGQASQLDMFAADFMVSYARSQGSDYDYHLRVYDKYKHILNQSQLAITEKAREELSLFADSIDFVTGVSHDVIVKSAELDANFFSAVNDAFIDADAVNLLYLMQKDTKDIMMKFENIIDLTDDYDSTIRLLYSVATNLEKLRLDRIQDKVDGKHFYLRARTKHLLDESEIEALARMVDLQEEVTETSYKYLLRSLDEQGLNAKITQIVNDYTPFISEASRLEIDKILAQ